MIKTFLCPFPSFVSLFFFTLNAPLECRKFQFSPALEKSLGPSAGRLWKHLEQIISTFGIWIKECEPHWRNVKSRVGFTKWFKVCFCTHTFSRICLGLEHSIRKIRGLAMDFQCAFRNSFAFHKPMGPSPSALSSPLSSFPFLMSSLCFLHNMKSTS